MSYIYITRENITVTCLRLHSFVLYFMSFNNLMLESKSFNMISNVSGFFPRCVAAEFHFFPCPTQEIGIYGAGKGEA